MSRVGRLPIELPEKVKVRVEKDDVHVEGPKGKLSHRMTYGIQAELKDNTVHVKRANDSGPMRAMHGLNRTILYNMIMGVSTGFQKQLEIQGVGFKAALAGKNLNLSLGFSHPVLYPIPEGISIKTPKPTQVVVEGINKALVGQVAADIRAFYKAEPYKGKGVRYVGENVRRKAGKAAVSK